MCLGVPGQVLQVDGDTAVVDFRGVRRRVSLDVVDEPVAPGDHVLVHVGCAIHRIRPEDLAETLAFFEALAADEREGPPPGAGAEP